MSEKDIYPESFNADAALSSGEVDVPEDDLELERDYIFLAQWLLDVHRELHAKKRSSADGED